MEESKGRKNSIGFVASSEDVKIENTNDNDWKINELIFSPELANYSTESFMAKFEELKYDTGIIKEIIKQSKIF